MGIKVKMQEDKSLPFGARFEAAVSSIEETDLKFGKTAKLWFEINNDPDHEGKKLSILANLKLSPKSKLFNIASTLKPELSDLEVGEELDLDELLGCKAIIELEKKEDSESGFPNIEKVLPWKEEK